MHSCVCMLHVYVCVCDVAVYVHTYTSIYVCVCVYMCICLHVCMSTPPEWSQLPFADAGSSLLQAAGWVLSFRLELSTAADQEGHSAAEGGFVSSACFVQWTSAKVNDKHVYTDQRMQIPVQLECSESLTPENPWSRSSWSRHCHDAIPNFTPASVPKSPL